MFLFLPPPLLPPTVPDGGVPVGSFGGVVPVEPGGSCDPDDFRKKFVVARDLALSCEYLLYDVFKPVDKRKLHCRLSNIEIA